MQTRIHAAGPNGQRSPGLNAAIAAWHAENPDTGGSSSLTATNTPEKPAEGSSASYLVSSAVTWPAGLVWSTDPDGGTAPAITGTALVSLFTLGGVTRAVMAATYPEAIIPDPDDETPPIAGTLSASGVTDSGFIISVSGASDETALHSTPYRFSISGGSTYSDWQESSVYSASELAAETLYVCRHQVRDAAENTTTGASIEVTTTASPVVDSLDAAILGHSPVGYWKLDETEGGTAIDYSGNGRHGTYVGDYTLEDQDGFPSFGVDGAVTVPNHADFTIGAETGLAVVALVKSLTWNSGGSVAPPGQHRIVGKYGTGYEWNFGWQGVDSGGAKKAMLASVWTSNGNDTAASTNRATSLHADWNEWHLLIWSVPTYASASTEMWVDAVAQTFTFKTPGSGAHLNTASPVLIGSPNNALGRVAIIPGPLTQQQADSLASAARTEGLIA